MLWSSNIWMFGWGMLGPLYAVFAEQVGGTVLELSWVYAMFLVVTGVGVLVVGRIADRVGHERLLVGGYALSALATYGYLLVGSVYSLFVVQVLLGIAIALSEPTWYALYDRHSGDGSHDGYIWGLASGLGYILRGTAMLIGGYIVTLFSFDVLFLAMGSLLMISTFYQARILRYRLQ